MATLRGNQRLALLDDIGAMGFRYSLQMRVTVLYFAVLKDLLGVEREMVELREGETVDGLVLVSRERASKQSEVWQSLAVAVNGGYASRTTVLRDGDEVALLPPVSGGLVEVRG